MEHYWSEREERRRHWGYLESEDGVWLFWQGFQPREPRASAVLVHGYNSSSNHLVPLMARLASEGIACYAADTRGHGRSEGERRHVHRFGEYVADVRALCAHAARRAPGRRTFLFGNSLGGLIVSLHSLLYPETTCGTVLTAPFFGPAFRVPRLLDCWARAASRFWPTFRVFLRDRTRPEFVTLRWWTETLAAQQALRKQAERFTAPVLLLHGQQDSVACPSASRSIFERLGSRDKTLRVLPNARHQDLDPARSSDCWTDVRDWLARRAAAASNNEG